LQALLVSCLRRPHRLGQSPEVFSPIGEGGIKAYMRDIHPVFAYALEVDYIQRKPGANEEPERPTDQTEQRRF